eukprot:snap_masked-scaffold_44-processed-gene-0.36-mRNA-1 protein AED:1.00 eAED:1.00 QI:0/0/0/0/1/1/10/0/836
MESRINNSKNSSERRILRESDTENNKEVLRRFHKIKGKRTWGDTQKTTSIPFKSLQTSGKYREKIEIKGILNTFLKGDKNLFSNNLQIIQENTILESFFLSEGKTVDLQLQFFETGIKAIFADTVIDEDGLTQVDPILTIWKRPNEVIRIVDYMGPNSLAAAVVLNIQKEEDLFNYVAQISAVSSSQSGLFTFTVLPIEPNPVPTNTSVQLDFNGSRGRNGRSATLIEGEFYQIFAYSKNSSLEDLLNTGIFVRAPDGTVLATNFGSSEIDFSARLLFQATESGDHILEIHVIKDGGNTVEQEATCIFYSVISPTEISLSTTSEITGDILAAKSQSYLITLEEDLEYEIFLESIFFEEFTELIPRTLRQENIEVLIPRFPPSLTLRIENPSTAELLSQLKTEFDYEFSHEDEAIVMNPVNLSGTSLTFSSNSRTPVLLEVFPTNPEYYTEEFSQIVGSFSISISARFVERSSNFVQLVDPNDPYSECFENPFELLAAGCNTGVFLFCRSEGFPFVLFWMFSENIFEAKVDEATLFCSCVGYICQEFPGSINNAEQTADISLVFDIILLIMGIICLCITCYLIYDYKKVFQRNKVAWKVLYKVPWILSILFFLNLLIYASARIILIKFFRHLDDLNNAYIGRQETFFRDNDYLFYENNPFDEIYTYLDYTLQTEYENPAPSNSAPFLNDAALEIYERINIDVRTTGDTFAFSQAIKKSLCMIQFIEISIAWVYVSFSASAVLRKKAQNQKERVILYIRVFQFTVGLNMLWYTLAKFITGGKIYSNIFYYLYALTATLVAGLLFYVILLFQRAIVLDRLYRSKMSSSTKSPNAAKKRN